jgi:flagellin-like protein
LVKRMKAISPMIATVLLIGFTIAVGAILSLWFTTFTRTQTTAVSGAAGCAANPIDVTLVYLNTNNGLLSYSIRNLGTHPVNVTSAVFSCDTGNWANSTLSARIDAGSSVVLTENTTAGSPGGKCTKPSSVGIQVSGYCIDVGGVTQGGCPVGTCAS